LTTEGSAENARLPKELRQEREEGDILVEAFEHQFRRTLYSRLE
jgi:hypothetical protein